jgi:Tfp pilus assembly PilM family ATPase
VLRRSSELTPIGLDLGEHEVRAVQLRRDRRSPAPVIAAAAAFRRPGSGQPTAEQVASILHTLDRQGFCGERFVLAMPQSKLLAAVLEVPPRTSGAPLDVICRNELARTHRLEPEQIESAWWELPAAPTMIREAEGAQALAVGCRQTDAEELIGAFDAVGAEVCAIDTRGPALARAAAQCSPPAPSLTAILEWDAEAAMVVVTRGDAIVYERFLPEAGLNSCQAELVKKLATDSEVATYMIERIGLGAAPAEFAEESELVDQAGRLLGERIDSISMELRASAAYAARRFGDGVAVLVVCGDGVHVPGATERLERRAEMPLKLATPQLLLPGSPELPHIARPTSLTAAIGLAAHPLEARP